MWIFRFARFTQPPNAHDTRIAYVLRTSSSFAAAVSVRFFMNRNHRPLLPSLCKRTNKSVCCTCKQTLKEKLVETLCNAQNIIQKPSPPNWNVNWNKMLDLHSNVAYVLCVCMCCPLFGQANSYFLFLIQIFSEIYAFDRFKKSQFNFSFFCSFFSSLRFSAHTCNVYAPFDAIVNTFIWHMQMRKYIMAFQANDTNAVGAIAVQHYVCLLVRLIKLK